MLCKSPGAEVSAGDCTPAGAPDIQHPQPTDTGTAIANTQKHRPQNGQKYQSGGVRGRMWKLSYLHMWHRTRNYIDSFWKWR